MQDKVITDILAAVAKTLRKQRDKVEKRETFEVPAYKFLTDQYVGCLNKPEIKKEENAGIVHMPSCVIDAEKIPSLIIALVNHCNKFAEEYKKLKEEKKTKVYNIDSYFTKEGDYMPKVVNQEIDVQKELTQLVNTANHFREVWQNELRAATNWEKQCGKLRADRESLEKNTLLRRKELAAQLSEFHVSLSDIIDNVY